MGGSKRGRGGGEGSRGCRGRLWEHARPKGNEVAAAAHACKGKQRKQAMPMAMATATCLVMTSS